MGEYVSKKKDMRFQSVDSLQSVVNVVNEDLTGYLKQISVPTLLIWGDLDTAVPIEDARYAESIMEDAGLVVYEGCTHYAYLERINQTISVLRSFLGGN